MHCAAVARLPPVGARPHKSPPPARGACTPIRRCRPPPAGAPPSEFLPPASGACALATRSANWARPNQRRQIQPQLGRALSALARMNLHRRAFVKTSYTSCAAADALLLHCRVIYVDEEPVLFLVIRADHRPGVGTDCVSTMATAGAAVREEVGRDLHSCTRSKRGRQPATWKDSCFRSCPRRIDRIMCSRSTAGAADGCSLGQPGMYYPHLRLFCADVPTYYRSRYQTM